MSGDDEIPLYEKILYYQGPVLASTYNQFFNPNICHVCKSVDDGKLISCTRCNLIFYCNKTHRRMHYTESHGEICQILTRTSDRTLLYREASHDMDELKWIQSRKLLLEEIKQKIQQDFNRPMEKYEEQMILYSKKCFFCFRQNDLQSCKLCLSINCCSRHLQYLIFMHPRDECCKLTILLNINIGKMFANCVVNYDKLFSQRDICIAPNELTDYSTQRVLFKYLLEPSRRHLKPADYILSDYISGPLTIYFGLKKSGVVEQIMGSTFIIHIINADSVDTNVSRAWEILFHLLSELRELIIVFIELRQYLDTNIEKCKFCDEGNKKLFVIGTSMSYHDFLQSQDTINLEATRNNYKKPNIIVGFGNNLSQWYTYQKTVEGIKAQNCPLFLICLSKIQASDIITKLKNVMGECVEPILNERNVFRSLVPYKNIATEDIDYRNSHIVIIYSYLHKSDDVGASSLMANLNISSDS